MRTTKAKAPKIYNGAVKGRSSMTYKTGKVIKGKLPSYLGPRK